MRARLSELIRAHGVRPLANEVGISDAALHRWMSGQSSLSWETLQRVAGKLGVTIERETIYDVKGSANPKEAA